MHLKPSTDQRRFYLRAKPLIIKSEMWSSTLGACGLLGLLSTSLRPVRSQESQIISSKLQPERTNERRDLDLSSASGRPAGVRCSVRCHSRDGRWAAGVSADILTKLVVGIDHFHLRFMGPSSAAKTCSIYLSFSGYRNVLGTKYHQTLPLK